MTGKDLPQEIITQILYSVPAKSIGRFRSVSKGWLSLLTHPDFIKSHDQNTLIYKLHHLFISTKNSNKKGPPALYSNSYNEPILTLSDFGFDREICSYYVPDVIICGSCNGLVTVSADDIDGYYIHLLLNPTTKESMMLPEIFDYSYMNDYECFESDCMFGFGYDSETGDFRFVFLDCVYDPITHGRIYVHVYSLRTNTWRRLTDTLDGYLSISSKEVSVFVNGFLHWIVTKTVNGLLESIVILAFSLADEKFSEMPSPDFVESTEYLSSDYCQLVVLGGKVALFHEMNGEIWLMNEYRIKESWTKISLQGMDGVPMVTPHRDSKPMVFYHDGKFMVANSDRMMVYDDEKGAFEETVCVWDPKKFKVFGSYVESLVSIASCIGE